MFLTLHEILEDGLMQTTWEPDGIQNQSSEGGTRAGLGMLGSKLGPTSSSDALMPACLGLVS